MKHNWQTKLSAQGLEFVELTAKLQGVKQPTSLSAEEVRRWVNEEKEILSSYPNAEDLGKKRKVDLDPKFVELIVKTDPEWELSEQETQQMFEEEEWPLLRAEHLEMHQRITLMLEADQALRFQAYSAVAYAIVFLRRMVSGTLKKQFGTKEISWFK